MNNNINIMGYDSVITNKESTEIVCNICNNSKNNKIHIAYEMFFGTREKFNYLECNNCKCVQLVDIIEDISKYYPSNYYTSKIIEKINFSKLDKSDENQYIKECLNICNLYYLRPLNINYLNLSFLDVGCGNGQVIRNLNDIGFKKVIGIDKYLHMHHIYESEHCKIYQEDLFNIEEKFDVIMFNHSFEHMNDHRKHLLKVSEILNPNGICIIRIPIVSYAWNLYGVNWFQLDAPRHLILHSFKSLELLFEQTKYELLHFFTDATESQFIISEIYKQGYSLNDERINNYSFLNEHISKKRQKYFLDLTEKLNKENLGDQIVLYLRKIH